MNAKVLTVVVGLLLLIPAGYAGSYKFGDCPKGYSCNENPNDGKEFPPDAVTGHTVYANFTLFAVDDDINNRKSLGLPTDFAAVAGFFAIYNEFPPELNFDARQRECVVWFNGYNLDQRPPATSSSYGFDDADNSYPSDEDETRPGDEAYQDYDFDRDVDNCLPNFGADNITPPLPIYNNFAVVVEKGDCTPEGGSQFRFRGHLDFADPNDIYHEVQEYDYVCGTFGFGGPGNVMPGLVQGEASPIVKSLFPWTYTDPHNTGGCDAHRLPDETNTSTDLGHKCNGSVQDLFTERMWMTPVHAPVFDPTIKAEYTFALQIDTCSGLNIYEVEGKEAMGESNGYKGSADNPGPTVRGVNTWKTIDTVDATLDTAGAGLPKGDVCHDGSSYSFDDTSRGRVSHDGPPATTEEIMRGNSYDDDPNSDTFGKHRTNCRHNAIDWPYNKYPGETPVGEDCYPEDHKTAKIDIYVFDHDITGGLWAANTNGLTGANAYAGHGTPTGPNDLPPY